MPPLMNVGLFLMFIILLFGTFGLHLFAGMHEFRCRVSKEPFANGSWPVLADNFDLCNIAENNCPEGSYCGAPGDYGIKWDKAEVKTSYEFQYYITGFDNIWQSMLTIF